MKKFHTPFANTIFGKLHLASLRFATLLSVFLIVFLILSGCKKGTEEISEKLSLASCTIGSVTLSEGAESVNAPLNQPIIITFNIAIDTNAAKQALVLKTAGGSTVGGMYCKFSNQNKTISFGRSQFLSRSEHYVFTIPNTLKSEKGTLFSGSEFKFQTTDGSFTLKSIKIEQKDFNPPAEVVNIPITGAKIEVEFSEAIDTTQLASRIQLSGSIPLTFNVEPGQKNLKIFINQQLNGYKKYNFTISSSLKSANGFVFDGFSNSFMTALDSTLKFPLISDDELLTLVQHQTFKFFYDYAHPVSGLTRERYGSGDIVTSGGSGFGIMALIVGIERGFISRSEGITQLIKIVNFLETCDRFHGAWSHWINGNTGAVVPFGTKDNGGDLVETAYVAQGLIAMRQYLNPSDPLESNLITRITNLYNGIEWDWYTRGGQNALYWHWSPNYGWDMNFKITGYNETLITYIMAASSPTHTIPASAYTQGYARNGAIVNGKTFYGYVLPVGWDYGGPLFFAHYSFLGLDPRNLSDNYANYWTQNVNHSLINWAYCAANPKGYPNYGAHCWGLTASDIPAGYGVSEPTNDRGVITPTAAISSLPYTPEQSMNAIRFFYYILGDKLWGNYGFYDAFDVHSSWWADSYLAIDQGPEIVMIENYRTGLLWNLFMSAPEVQAGLTKLGFSFKKSHKHR
jgi:hypothetical protein